MRLDIYGSLDEMLDDLAQVVIGRSYGMSMDWTPKRREGLYALSGHFPKIIIDACNKLGYSYDLVDKVSLNPSLYLKTAYRFQMITKSLAFDTDEISKCFFYLMNCSVLARKKSVDIYSAFWKNNRSLFSTVNDQSEKRLISFINADLRAYSELIYCDDHSVGGEIVGPIKIDNLNMVVRDYHSFNPGTMEFMPNKIPFKRIRTYCVYDCTDIDVDVNGNLQSCQNMVSGLRRYCIEVEKTNDAIFYVSSIVELAELLKNLDDTIVAFKRYYQSLSKEYQTQLLIDTQYYALRDLFDTAGENWKDSCIANRTFVADSDYLETNKVHRKPFFEIKDEDELWQFTKDMIDPRKKW